jgi:hypothetical protein
VVVVVGMGVWVGLVWGAQDTSAAKQATVSAVAMQCHR